MNKLKLLFGGLLLALGCLGGVPVRSEASVVARAPKKAYTLTYSTVISSITPFTVLQATSTLQDQPGAVYQVVLSSGAASEYITLFDTVPFNTGFLANTTVGQTYQLGPRLLFGSTTANTTITFDPPMIFYHGLMILDSAVTGQATILYEEGRGISGQ